MADNGLHAGHRERMLKKYSENGIDCFEDHEKLEILLFSVFSRINTNDISHRLLNRFGSLSGVLNANLSDLEEIEGIGKNAAIRIRFFGDFYRALSEDEPKKIILNGTDQTVEYCRTFLDFKVEEYMVAFFLDHKNRLINRYIVSDNRSNSVGIRLNKLSQKVVESKCRCVILVHTHTDLPVLPSESDYITTRKIANMLKMLDVELLDHIIISPTSEHSMRGSGDLRDVWC